MKKHIPEFVQQLFSWFGYVGECLKPKVSNKTVTLTRELMPMCPIDKVHRLRLEGGSYFCLLCAQHYERQDLILPELPTACKNCNHDLTKHRRNPYIARVWHCSGDDMECGCGSYEQNKEI
jgi:hypothetical protein